MSYENDKAMYIAAAAEATAAAVVLMSPVAKTIAVMIGTMLSDPEGMRKLAEQWRDSALGSEAPDLEGLGTAIADLRRMVDDDGWKGEARQKFDAASTAFLEEMRTLAAHRTSAGDTVEQTALIFHIGAQVVFWAAQLMAYLAVVSLATMIVPVMRVSAQIAIHKTLTTIGQGVMALVRTKMNVVLSAAAIFSIVNLIGATQAQLFLGLEAITDKTPDFKDAGLDHAAGTLAPSMDPDLSPQPQGGLMGML
ncbi:MULTISPECIES: WXG100 family type VII secretion target [unclassified Streptosporangium]|uniref:WXG100 family type VII secretion target n=1 Tax=unclassified Streptosporangium TaxID=2632669 RepID=UPI002E2B6D2D|nr:MULTISPECIES: hypothetical protein [unclassified Streptosporangium]